MKLTDKKIIEALKAGKKIRIDNCQSREAKLFNGYLEYCDNHREVLICIDLLERDDFEIVEPDNEWDRLIIDKVLCKFWDKSEEPTWNSENWVAGFLVGYSICNGRAYAFECRCAGTWLHCRPLRVDEITLATDEKELLK